MLKKLMSMKHFSKSATVWLMSILLTYSVNGRAAPLHEEQTETLLEEALALHNNTRGDAWIIATDPNERHEALFSSYILKQMAEAGDDELLFAAIDEAFELELDRDKGIGAPPVPPKGLPYLPRPVHRGERGGLDGSSCRVCHFSGGPDGSGSGTSLALFRGDGEHLSTSAVRDAPSLMGAGYVAALALEMSEALQKLRKHALATARRIKGPFRIELDVQGIKFGWLTVDPSGDLDLSEVEGVGPDLKIRPFGWKGRHHDLSELADEALQLHHGLQSDSRAARYQDQAEEYIGMGPAWDADQDGIEQEIGGGHPAALAAYLTLLAAPIYNAPAELSTSLHWAEGRRWFEEIGCASCHVPSIRVTPRPLSIKSRGRYPVEIEVDPFQSGQEPRLRRLDYSQNTQGQIPMGIPVFLFSDLKRHDMGTGLAEKESEKLPNGQFVPGHVWLTRPLWGLADSAPYLHDGSAQTVEEAILRHGGEALTSRQLYEGLSSEARGQLRLFLMSLSRPATLLVE